MRLKAGGGAIVGPGGWIILGGKFQFYPAPTGTAQFPYIRKTWAAASDGYLTVTQDNVVMMLQSAEWPEDIDRVRAERSERKAREALLQQQDRQSYLMNQAMLLRAMTRLRVSDHHRVNQ